MLTSTPKGKTLISNISALELAYEVSIDDVTNFHSSLYRNEALGSNGVFDNNLQLNIRISSYT